MALYQGEKPECYSYQYDREFQETFKNNTNSAHRETGTSFLDISISEAQTFLTTGKMAPHI